MEWLGNKGMDVNPQGAAREKVESMIDEVKRKEGKSWEERKAQSWCTCNMEVEGYSYNIPEHTSCPICKLFSLKKHSHCGACLRLLNVIL